MSVRSGPLTPAPPNVSSSLAAAAAAAYDSLGIACKYKLPLYLKVARDPGYRHAPHSNISSHNYCRHLSPPNSLLIVCTASVGSYNTSRHSPCSPSQASSGGLYSLNGNSAVPFPSSNPGMRTNANSVCTSFFIDYRQQIYRTQFHFDIRLLQA